MQRYVTGTVPSGTRRRTAPSALLLALVVLIAASPAHAQSQAPPDYKPQGYVNDFANVLSPAARQQLTALCTEVDQKAHAQIAVVTVPTTNGQPIVDYTFNLATKWGVGPKQSNRGILILFAVNDHKYWTQVGYGLEPILPDGKVGGFGREAVPILRQGNYDAAVLLMTRRIADVIAQDAGVALSGVPPSQLHPQRDRQRLHTSPLVLLLLLIMIIVALMFLGGGSGGGSGYAWWLAPFIAANMNRGRWGGGGFGGSSWGGGGDSGGGGGGFGGFGGGDFGGGGAGGSW